LVAGSWTVAEIADARRETSSGRVLVLDVPGWGGNIAGQHLDARLTAADGYQAARSYSVASAGPGDRVEIAVDRLPGGEVSPFLVDEAAVGDQLEVRGPLGGWFVWRPEQQEPVQLIGGGSGVVPLVAMIRSHAQAGSTAQFRLLYSVRSPERAFFRTELSRPPDGVSVTWIYTRSAPEHWPRATGRLTTEDLEREAFPPDASPTVYVCGPTRFVEAVASGLVQLGHDPQHVKTERFGG